MSTETRRTIDEQTDEEYIADKVEQLLNSSPRISMDRRGLVAVDTGESTISLTLNEFQTLVETVVQTEGYRTDTNGA